jgi:hypothetical protein
MHRRVRGLNGARLQMSDCAPERTLLSLAPEDTPARRGLARGTVLARYGMPTVSARPHDI